MFSILLPSTRTFVHKPQNHLLFIAHTLHTNTHTNHHRTSHKPLQSYLATSKPWICTLRFMAVKWRFTEGNAVIGSAKPQGSDGGTPWEPCQPWSSRHWVHSVNGYFAAMHPNVPTTTIITQISFPQPHTILIHCLTKVKR